MINMQYKFIFLNQMAGPLFRELAEDISKEYPYSLLYTGHPDTISRDQHQTLKIVSGPIYDRRNMPTRFFSWLHYFVRAFWVVFKQPKTAPILIVSNPPFLGAIGLFYKLFRGQNFYMLVYDIYPDLLIELGKIKKGFLAQVWNFFNSLVYSRASAVFTIGRDMVERLETKFDASFTEHGEVVYAPSWADVESIIPLPKEENWFAKEHGQLNKTTVLYSGNMGITHDIESILEVAKKLAYELGIHFLFIGEGAKWKVVEQTIIDSDLENITLLPFQPENILPYSITCGDIGVVSYQKGTEGCIVPSKSYYYLAAGLALLAVGHKKCELETLVAKHSCGIYVESGSIDRMAEAILQLHNDQKKLKRTKQAARDAAVHYFSRKNSRYFSKVICHKTNRISTEVSNID